MSKGMLQPKETRVSLGQDVCVECEALACRRERCSSLRFNIYL